MHKIIYYLKLNFAKKQIRIITVISLISINLSSFLSFLNFSHIKEQNWYDLIIFIFGTYIYLAYFLFFIFFLFIYNIGAKKCFYKYIFLKFKDRKQWYNINILQILILSILYTSFTFIICFLEGVSTLSFKNQWSPYILSLCVKPPVMDATDTAILKYVIDTVSPLTYIAINIFYVICFFFVIGMLYYIFSMCFKKKLWAIVGVCILNFINIALYRSDNINLNNCSFYHYIIVLGSSNENLSIFMFLTRFFYWVFLIGALYIIGRVITKKMDFNFEESL